MITNSLSASVGVAGLSNAIDIYGKDLEAPAAFNPSFIHMHARPRYNAQLQAVEQHQPCGNCGHLHPRLHQSSPANCFFITIRRSGRDRLPLSTPKTVTVSTRRPQPSPSRTSREQHSRNLPSHPVTQHHLLRDYIWNEFESLKAEVDLDRDHIALHRDRKSKGQLKEKAPLPWLSWSSPSGQSGQTRNRENFFAIWDKVMAGCSRETRGGDVLVSSVLMPTDFDMEVVALQAVVDQSAATQPHRVTVISTPPVKRSEQRVAPSYAPSRWDQGRIVAVS